MSNIIFFLSRLVFYTMCARPLSQFLSILTVSTGEGKPQVLKVQQERADVHYRDVVSSIK